MKTRSITVAPAIHACKPKIEEKTEKRRRGATVGEVFSNYADIASLNGVAFIKTSEHPAVKAVWALLLMAAIGAMTFHLYTMFDKYFQYSKHSEINTGFSDLSFPAVTICNVNIMRKSQLMNASDRVQLFVNEVLPGVIQSFEEFDVSYDYNYDYYPYEDNLENSSSTNDGETENYGIQEYDVPLEDVGNISSSLSDAEGKFQDLFSLMNISVQRSLGHQLNDMLLQCTFSRTLCRLKKVSPITTSTYGNCYTIEDRKFVAHKSGPDNGLELILFLEVDEYISGVTSGRGAHVIIHEQGSIPIPEDEGFAIPAGVQTLISLKQINIQRLGEPYSPCKSIDDMAANHNVTYTRNVCQKICVLNSITSECNCYDERFEKLVKLMKITTIQACATLTELNCVSNVSRRFKESDRTACDCLNPCSENTYEKMISFRQWPGTDMARYLVNNVCKNKPEMCDIMNAKSEQDLKENFLKLNIYFEDLNYEELSEQPNYDFTQLLSEIGGTIGLWIGLSILSLFELLHLSVQLVHSIVCQRFWK